MTLGKAIAYLFEFGGAISATTVGFVFYSGISTYSHNEWLLWLFIVLTAVSFLLAGIMHFFMGGPEPVTATSAKRNILKARFYLSLSFAFGIASIAVQIAGLSTFTRDPLLLWILLLLWVFNVIRSSLHAGKPNPT